MSTVKPAPLPQNGSKQLRRTLVLWLVLIALFVGIWRWLAPSPSASPPQPPAPPHADTPGFPATYLLLFFVVAFFLFLRRLQVSGGKFAAGTRQIADLVQRGQLDEAARLSDELRDKSRKNAAQFGFASNGAAEIALRRGKLDDAERYLADAEKGKTYYKEIRHNNARLGATLYALRGELETAQQWLDEEKARGKEQAVTYDILLPETILLCRRGDYDGASARLAGSWAVAERALRGDALRYLQVVRLFVQAQRGGVREAGQIEPELAALRRGPAGDYAWLGVAWPEMAAFLAAHQLT